MPHRPHIVLADDLTGAAEVAAIAHEAGLRAVVVTHPPRQPVEADVLVIDTDTRLSQPAAAARRVRACVARLQKLPHAGFFKKTDSVLRGPVLAELQACATALGLKRSLLIAANPSLGRTIEQGRLLIEGQPVNETAFAHDPHHPAHSAAVLALLGPAKNVVNCPPEAPLPRTGIIAGDHRSTDDTRLWARAVDPSTLPAGGADFFRAWLATQSRRRRRATDSGPPPEPALLLHGTTASNLPARTVVFNGLRPPPPVRVSSVLRQERAAAVAATRHTLRDPLAPDIVARGFAELTKTLHDEAAFRHLVVAGGATAATVLHALRWNELHVARVWAPGVVSLRPTAAPDCIVTLKPGSYAWPESLRRQLPGVFP